MYFSYFYHPDHIGSTSYVTDDQGDVYEHLEYFQHGESWVEERGSSEKLPYLFTGKELDEETGLYYYGARYYDPRTSVWQSPDPILGKYMPKGDASKEKNLIAGGVKFSKNLSLYSYGFQNPLKYHDPTGKSSEKKQQEVISPAKTKESMEIEDREDDILGATIFSVLFNVLSFIPVPGMKIFAAAGKIAFTGINLGLRYDILNNTDIEKYRKKLLSKDYGQLSDPEKKDLKTLAQWEAQLPNLWMGLALETASFIGGIGENYGTKWGSDLYNTAGYLSTAKFVHYYGFTQVGRNDKNDFFDNVLGMPLPEYDDDFLGKMRYDYGGYWDIGPTPDSLDGSKKKDN